MPIRLCQKCGLKVLIDESQAGTNPFYCQRCTTAMKGQEGAAAPAPGPITPVRNPTPSPVMSGRSEPAAPSVGAAKAATVRVLCPYCKASFNGRVPQKPARGSCPVCQKELILLPNGDIKPSAGFDLGSYQGEPAPPPLKDPTPSPVAESAPRESGTRLLVKKYAADPGAAVAPPAPVARRAEPKPPPADTDVSEENPLPTWLDDSGSAGAPVKPMAETADEIEISEPKKDVEDDHTIKVEDPFPAPPPPAPRARMVVAKNPSVASGRPPAGVPAQAPAARPVTEVPPAKPAVRALRSAPAAAPAASPAEEGVETGSGKVFFAIVLALLPVIAVGGLLSSQDKLKVPFVQNLGTKLTKGFGEIHKILFPPPPPPKPKMEEKAPEPEPPKEEPPKADPEQQKKDELAITHLYEQILRMERDLKQSSVAATPEQKTQLEEVRKKIGENKEKYARQREMYQKLYGKEYDPTK